MRLALIGIVSFLAAPALLAQNANRYQPTSPYHNNSQPRVLFTPVPTPLPVLFDNSGVMTLNGAASGSVAFVDSASSNRALVVFVNYQDDLNCTNCAATISALTYGAQALTFNNIRTSLSGAFHQEIWFKIAPLTGSNSLAITFTDLVDAVVGFSSYVNTNQTFPFGATKCSNVQSTTNPLTNVPSAPQNIIVDGLASSIGTSTTATVDGSQTQMFNTTTGPNGGLILGAGSRKGSGALTTMQWTLSNAKDAIECGVEVKR